MKSSFVKIALITLALCRVVAAAASAPSSESTAYKIRQGDLVSITVYGRESLGVSGAAVDATGEFRIAGVSHPIPVAGLSVADIQAIVESRYRKAGLEDPRVAVFGSRVIEGNRMQLFSSVPPLRMPGDPVRSDAKQE